LDDGFSDFRITDYQITDFRITDFRKVGGRDSMTGPGQRTKGLHTRPVKTQGFNPGITREYTNARMHGHMNIRTHENIGLKPYAGTGRDFTPCIPLRVTLGAQVMFPVSYFEPRSHKLPNSLWPWLVPRPQLPGSIRPRVFG